MRSGRLGCVGFLSCVVLAGCATTQAPVSHTRIAVLPVSWQTRDTLPDLEERAPLREGLRSVSTVTVLEPDPEPPCDAEDDECMRRIGRELRADKIVVTTMAALGDTVLVRVSVLDVDRGTRDETRQRVVSNAVERRVREALSALGRQIAEPFAPERSEGEWYEQWWVWALAGTLLAGAAAAAVVGVAVSEQQGPDVVITPP